MTSSKSWAFTINSSQELLICGKCPEKNVELSLNIDNERVNEVFRVY